MKATKNIRLVGFYCADCEEEMGFYNDTVRDSPGPVVCMDCADRYYEADETRPRARQERPPTPPGCEFSVV